MMNRSTTGGEHTWRVTCRRFALDTMSPHVRRCDEERLFPALVHERAASEGILNASFPESLGGRGLSVRAFVEGVEELSAVCPSITWTLVFNRGALQPLLLAGTPEQQDLFIKQLIARGGYASLCLTEPDSGSNLLALKTRAVNTDGGWLLNGEKCMIGNGSVADTFLVLADTLVDGRRRGLSFFAVPRGPGVSVGQDPDKLGFRCLPTPPVTFSDVELKPIHLVGAVGEGENLLNQVLASIRLGGAACGIGLVVGALRDALPWVTQRRVYPDEPLVSLSHVQLMLGRIYVELTAARHLLLHAADLADQGKPFGGEASMAKFAGTELAVRATSEILQLYGWRGVDAAYGAGKRWRDARPTTIFEGSSEVQLLNAFRDLRRMIANEEGR